MNNTRIQRFMGSLDAIENADIVIAGFPYDGTATFRAGARFASREIRAYSSQALETFSFYFGTGLDEVKFFDAGDMEVMLGNPAPMVENVKDTASIFLKNSRKLVGIGGEHLITYPLFMAAQKKHPGLSMLHLDAHADLAEEMFGERLSHGTVMYLCLQHGLQKLIQFGIRSGSKQEYLMRESDSRIIPAATIEQINEAIQEDEKIYLSLDVDFFDPGFFPGTGTPEAGGASFDDYIRILNLLKQKKVDIIGADIVELAPELDQSRASTIFAGKLLRETLICMGD